MLMLLTDVIAQLRHRAIRKVGGSLRTKVMHDCISILLFFFAQV